MKAAKTWHLECFRFISNKLFIAFYEIRRILTKVLSQFNNKKNFFDNLPNDIQNKARKKNVMQIKICE